MLNSSDQLNTKLYDIVDFRNMIRARVQHSLTFEKPVALF